MKVSMRNKVGITRDVKIGFSWTALFFGPCPLFFRGMAMKGVLWCVISFVTSGLSNLVLMCIINKMTAYHYLENGYTPIAGEGWDKASEKWGITLPENNDLSY